MTGGEPEVVSISTNAPVSCKPLNKFGLSILVDDSMITILSSLTIIEPVRFTSCTPYTALLKAIRSFAAKCCVKSSPVALIKLGLWNHTLLDSSTALLGSSIVCPLIEADVFTNFGSSVKASPT